MAGQKLPTDVRAMADRIALAERTAEELLVEKQQIIDIDRRRNENRMALGELRRKALKDERKVWMNFGDLFIQFPKDACQSMVEEEQERLTQAIDEAHAARKDKVAALKRMEGVELSGGWDLKGMSEKEFSAPPLPS